MLIFWRLRTSRWFNIFGTRNWGFDLNQKVSSFEIPREIRLWNFERLWKNPPKIWIKRARNFMENDLEESKESKGKRKYADGCWSFWEAKNAFPFPSSGGPKPDLMALFFAQEYTTTNKGARDKGAKAKKPSKPDQGRFWGEFKKLMSHTFDFQFSKLWNGHFLFKSNCHFY